MVEQVGPEAFDGTRLRRADTVAVAFLADWCPFCREFRPEFERLRTEGMLELLVADMTDLESPLWDRFRIEVVPTVVVFRSGKPVYRADGVAGEGLGSGAIDAIRRAASESAGRRASPP
jgi:thioredoxin 1